MVPGAGLTQWEEMNHKDKTDRFKGGGIERLGAGPMGDGAAEQGVRSTLNCRRRSLLRRRSSSRT